MFGYDREARSKCVRRQAGFATLTVVALATFAGGCSSLGNIGSGSKTQVMFYAPPGATVQMKHSSSADRQIAEAGEFSKRLETAPDEHAIFDLSPGSYEFKYTSADGLPGVSVYGELEVYHARTHEASVYQRRAIIPVQLPSEFYQKVEAIGDEGYPYRGQRYRTIIDEMDLNRLRQGDVIEKVVFVANLGKVEGKLAKVDQDIVALEREMEYADLRFRTAYQDFRMGAGADDGFSLFPKDRQFIKWEKKRKKLEQEMLTLTAMKQRLEALLKGDHVLARNGMLVMATEEVVDSHMDIVEASEELGDIMIVMRIGGRHWQWGSPAQEVASNRE